MSNKNYSFESQISSEMEGAAVIRFTWAWTERVLSLATSAFGEHYLSPEKLKAYLNRPNSFFLAVNGDELLGYCLFLLEDAATASKELKIDANTLTSACPGRGPICHTKSMAITPHAQRNGMGDRLFHRCLTDSVSQGARSAWGTAWKIGDRVPMDTIFRRHGFEVYGEIPLVWFDDKDYICSVCNGPCRCTGVVYHKELTGLMDGVRS